MPVVVRVRQVVGQATSGVEAQASAFGLGSDLTGLVGAMLPLAEKQRRFRQGQPSQLPRSQVILLHEQAVDPDPINLTQPWVVAAESPPEPPRGNGESYVPPAAVHPPRWPTVPSRPRPPPGPAAPSLP